VKVTTTVSIEAELHSAMKKRGWNASKMFEDFIRKQLNEPLAAGLPAVSVAEAEAIVEAATAEDQARQAAIDQARRDTGPTIYAAIVEYDLEIAKLIDRGAASDVFDEIAMCNRAIEKMQDKRSALLESASLDPDMTTADAKLILCPDVQ